MDADTVAQVFDPFFTTKPTGQGTGLGLAMVYTFTRQVGGFARVYSEPGRGTTMTIAFRVDDALLGKTACENEVESHEPGNRLQGHVLIVDDQAAVRDIAVNLFKEFGMTSETADCGDTALAMLKSEQTFDLVFTDIVMPGSLDGVALSKAAASFRPDLPFVFATGYAEASLLRSSDIETGKNLLNKPYRRDALEEVVRQALEQAKRTVMTQEVREMA
jgi:CheY-like chemotaxis protein